MPTARPELSEAVERDFIAAWWLIAEAAGYELHDDDGLRWFHTGTPDHHLNAVLTTDLPTDGSERRVAELMAELKRRGAPFLWWALPSSRPANVAELLGSHGLVREEPWPGMAVAVADLVEPPRVDGLQIRRVVDEASYDAYEGVYAPIMSPSQSFTDALRSASLRLGFDDDAPEVHFVGELDGEPVATTSLFTAGGTAGIYNVATVEAARGRGIGAAMTAHAVGAGAERGLGLATLQASKMGRPVYERLGFEFVCDLVPYRFSA